MSELSKRTITAAIMIIATFLALFTLSAQAFGIASLVVFSIGIFELCRLNHLNNPLTALMIAIFTGLGCLSIFSSIGELIVPPIFVIAATFWLLFLLLLASKVSIQFVSPSLSTTLSGLFIIYIAWLALTFLHSTIGPGKLLYLMGLIWIADSGAYFTGKRFGQHKLAPSISPGKSMEGLAGALAFALIYLLIAIWLKLFPITILAGLTLVFISVVGDLTESQLKRQAGIKDSGNILPGHGGILDRIDSLLAVLPCYAAWLTLIH
jgi:phosphatidate cytidylyltransferase